MQRLADGALRGADLSEAEARLKADPALARAFQRIAAENAAIRAGIPEPDPDRLIALNARARMAATGRSAPWRIAAMLALVAIGFGAGWASSLALRSLGPSPRLAGAEELVAAADAAYRLYSVEVLHPVEVGAGERDHLNAWLSNRLGGRIAAPELAEGGFHLIGGRLLPGPERAAALFMYEDASGARVALYVTPGTGAARAPRIETAGDGLTTVAWADEKWRYALVGAVPRDRLEALVRHMQGAMI
ncbi:MAG: anti-sigma factor [Alphaproteobacteria bacterium]|nr:MAG: anti-sigma factor [Alphaproteobacteria bacterium]